DVQAAKISMVEHVEHVGAELQFDALVNGEVFCQTQIQAPRSRTSHRACADSSRPQRDARSRSNGHLGESRLVQIRERLAVIWVDHGAADVTRPRIWSRGRLVQREGCAAVGPENS